MNGWENYETWNVSLWMQNDEALYNIANRCANYEQFMDEVIEHVPKTPDGVAWNDCEVNHIEIDAMMAEL